MKEKKGFHSNIEEQTLSNEFFRKVLYTGKYSQLVLMSLNPGEEIGMEVHPTIDQFFRIEKGEGKIIVNKTEYKVKDGSAVIVPAGSEHNVINTSKTQKLKLYTIYSPPEHKDGIQAKTKEEAEEKHKTGEFDGKTSE